MRLIRAAGGLEGEDWLVTAGVVLLGAALFLWFGWAAVLAYAGALMALVGLVLAVRGQGK